MNLNNPGLLTHFTSRFTFVLLEDVLSASPPETSDFRDSETYFMPLSAAESVLVKVKFVAVWSSPPTQNHDKWSQIRLFRPRLTTTIMTVVKIRIHIVRNFFMLTSSLKTRSAWVWPLLPAVWSQQSLYVKDYNFLLFFRLFAIWIITTNLSNDLSFNDNDDWWMKRRIFILLLKVMLEYVHICNLI